MKTIEVIVPAAIEAERVKFVAHLVSTATHYSSDMSISDGRNNIDLKSIMGMLTLVMSAGKSFTVTVSGKDEDVAATAISNYFFEWGV